MNEEELSVDNTNDQKKKKAILISGIITAVIFLVWIVFFIKDSEKKLNDTASSRVAIFGPLEENVSKAVNDLKTEISKFKLIFNVGQE